jgi:hypothetical protein
MTKHYSAIARAFRLRRVRAREGFGTLPLFFTFGRLLEVSK